MQIQKPQKPVSLTIKLKISQDLKVVSTCQAHFGLFNACSGFTAIPAAALDVELDQGSCSQNTLIKSGFYIAVVATFF